jgi:hypothetical protein
MSRQCKPGHRARIIGDGLNSGQIVLVVRPYFYPEIVADATWPNPLFPWVVTSLGAPLRSIDIETGEECNLAMTIVVDDCDLEPLDYDDDGIREMEVIERPVAKGSRLVEPAGL